MVKSQDIFLTFYKNIFKKDLTKEIKCDIMRLELEHLDNILDINSNYGLLRNQFESRNFGGLPIQNSRLNLDFLMKWGIDLTIA